MVRLPYLRRAKIVGPRMGIPKPIFNARFLEFGNSVYILLIIFIFRAANTAQLEFYAAMTPGKYDTLPPPHPHPYIWSGKGFQRILESIKWQFNHNMWCLYDQFLRRQDISSHGIDYER